MTLTLTPSPNHDTRGDQPVDMLVLHYTGMRSGKDALARLCDVEAKVSAHYLIEEDGTVYQLVEESQRAWHAGVSGWRGHSNINARSIGIELVNPGHEWGYRPFPMAQMEPLAELCQRILARHAIPARNVVAHSDVAYLRKQDPGELFDWAWMAKQGIGLWPDEQAAKRTVAAEGEADIRHRLNKFGYTIGDELQSGEDLRACMVAFQRHFRPSRCDGHWDAECSDVLDNLLKKI